MSLFKRSVGKKLLMAVTGTLLVLFVVPHMIGNFAIFAGADKLNNYAAFLQSLGPVLWLFRIVMLTALVLHIITGIHLYLENKAARPVAYAAQTYQASSLSSRTMIFSGLLLFGFILFHLLHLTLGVIHPEFYQLVDEQGRHDVYAMTVLSFQQIGTVAVYLVGMVVLFFHVKHGFASLFQSLGLNTERLLPRLAVVSCLLALVLLVGYLSIPFSALFNLLKA